MKNHILKLYEDHNKKRLMYMDAWEKNDQETLERLSEDYVIQSEFKFMNDLFHTFKREKKLNLMPLPYFKADGDTFASLIHYLTSGLGIGGRLKIMGQLTNTYGTIFLNNLYVIKHLYGSNYNIDEIPNLDHSKMLEKRVAQRFTPQLFSLLRQYSFRRVFKLLISAHEGEVVDCNNMIKDADLRAITYELPPKPRSFIEVHDVISFVTLKKRKVNQKLKQDIEFLDGKLLLDYKIEVPKESFDLIATSGELNHCVHSYDEAIIKKQAQVLNLVKDNRRIYTIELRPSVSGHEVVQFKGRNNNAIMEGSQGRLYVSELLKMLKNR